jgi:cysteine synthase
MSLAMIEQAEQRGALKLGMSTGLNVAAALDLAARLPSSATVVTVACDTGLKYMAGDLFDS